MPKIIKKFKVLGKDVVLRQISPRKPSKTVNDIDDIEIIFNNDQNSRLDIDDLPDGRLEKLVPERFPSASPKDWEPFVKMAIKLRFFKEDVMKFKEYLNEFKPSPSSKMDTINTFYAQAFQNGDFVFAFTWAKNKNGGFLAVVYDDRGVAKTQNINPSFFDLWSPIKPSEIKKLDKKALPKMEKVVEKLQKKENSPVSGFDFIPGLTNESVLNENKEKLSDIIDSPFMPPQKIIPIESMFEILGSKSDNYAIIFKKQGSLAMFKTNKAGDKRLASVFGVRKSKKVEVRLGLKKTEDFKAVGWNELPRPVKELIINKIGNKDKISFNESTLTEDLKLGKKDNDVINAFIDGKSATSKKLDTDGKTLDGLWMGGGGIAGKDSSGKIVMGPIGGRSGQTVQRKIRKLAPKNDIKEEAVENFKDFITEVKEPKNIKEILLFFQNPQALYIFGIETKEKNTGLPILDVLKIVTVKGTIDMSFFDSPRPTLNAIHGKGKQKIKWRDVPTFVQKEVIKQLSESVDEGKRMSLGGMVWRSMMDEPIEVRFSQGKKSHQIKTFPDEKSAEIWIKSQKGKQNFIFHSAINRMTKKWVTLKEGTGKKKYEDAPTNNVGDGNIDFTPTKRKKRNKFAEHTIFEVDCETFSKVKREKITFERMAKHFNIEDGVGAEIHKFNRTHPFEGIVLQDEQTGAMMFFKRKRERPVKESINESFDDSNIIAKGIFSQDGKKILGARSGKYTLDAQDKNGFLKSLSWKDYKKLNVPDKSSDFIKDEFVKSLFSKEKSFGKKIDFNGFIRKNPSASFEQKVDWILKNTKIKLSKAGIKAI